LNVLAAAMRLPSLFASRNGKEAGVDIGEPLRIYTVEPVEDPVPRREPAPAPPQPKRPAEEPDPARSA
jgi:hypothetical protein